MPCNRRRPHVSTQRFSSETSGSSFGFVHAYTVCTWMLEKAVLLCKYLNSMKWTNYLIIQAITISFTRSCIVTPHLTPHSLQRAYTCIHEMRFGNLHIAPIPTLWWKWPQSGCISRLTTKATVLRKSLAASEHVLTGVHIVCTQKGIHGRDAVKRMCRETWAKESERDQTMKDVL